MAKTRARRHLVLCVIVTSLLTFSWLVACSTHTKGPAPSSRPHPNAQGFIHPGVLVNRGELRFVKQQIAAGGEPWSTAFTKAKNSKLGSLRYTPRPRADVACGGHSIPNLGCFDERYDATAAYTDALLWSYTGKSAYAKKAVEILNSWSRVLRQHSLSNAPLETAWAAELFVRGAEIIRYTSDAWAPADVHRFTNMLNNVYLKEIEAPATASVYASDAGNWHLSAIDAQLNIAVFTDDRQLFDRALNQWRARVPAYLYLRTDNAGNGLPVAPPGWSNATRKLTCFWLGNRPGCATVTQLNLRDGQTQETCRDLGHASMGLASLINAAETAHLQRVDLYGEQQERIVRALELTTHLLNTGNHPPGFCNNSPPDMSTTIPPTFEIAYNEYAQRMGLSLLNTRAVIARLRRKGGSGVGSATQMAWETLTHGDTGLADVSF